MKTPLEVIQETIENLDNQNCNGESPHREIFNAVTHAQGSIMVKEFHDTRIEVFDSVSRYITTQTLALLQALRAELDNTLPEYWLNDESVPFHCDHNNAIKDCRKVIDNLDALIKEVKK